MKDYAYYINVKKGTLKKVKLSEAQEEHRVMLDYTDIFISDIYENGRIKLSDKDGIPLYCEEPESIFIYFEKFCKMIDIYQQEELCEWFFNSEYADYYLLFNLDA